jgi:hypothetical protein
LLCLSGFEVGGITEKRMGLTMSGWQAKSNGSRAALSGRPPWANLAHPGRQLLWKRKGAGQIDPVKKMLLGFFKCETVVVMSAKPLCNHILCET